MGSLKLKSEMTGQLNIFLIYFIFSALSVVEHHEIESAIKMLESKEDFDNFVTNDIEKVVVIGFFKDAVSVEAMAYKTAAEAFGKEVEFGITSNNVLMTKVKDENLILLIKGFDEGMNKLEGAITSETVTDFVNTFSHPLIAELEPATGFETPITFLIL